MVIRNTRNDSRRKDVYKRQKLPSAYTSEEIKKIVSSVDRSTTTGKRNYSIILLATMLGLRASDIANLKFENILWEDNAIRLIQHKTNKEDVYKRQFLQC